MDLRYPMVMVEGGPEERGRQYGTSAMALIDRTISAYRLIFKQFVGIDWSAARRIAAGYIAIADGFDRDIMDEIRGIASGSGHSVEDIMALNVRSEIMLVARSVLTECTALAATGTATFDRHTLIGQNWDWVPTVADSCILLIVKQSGRPSIVTLVEAGLLAKVGCNSAGVGVCANVLVCDRDRTSAGVPIHLMLRRTLSSANLAEAVGVITYTRRAGSLNY